MEQERTPIHVMVEGREKGKYAPKLFGGVPAPGDLLELGGGFFRVIGRLWRPGGSRRCIILTCDRVEQ